MLLEQFIAILSDQRAAERAVERFLRVVEERTGLLVNRGEGVYALSHLTFQEYLTALAVAGRDDYIAYTLQKSGETWWREVVLLETGHLSTQGKERTTRLLQAIADHPAEPEPYHNLVLAAECLRDIGSGRVDRNIQVTIQSRLRRALDTPRPWYLRVTGRGVKSWIERHSAAVQALVKSGAGYWSPPYGEPEWIIISAGEFWMGEGGSAKKIHLDAFRIARVPISNAQYQLFIRAVQHRYPRHWEEGRPPRGEESHPVTNVSWDDAAAYVEWLSDVTGRSIVLPTEEQDVYKRQPQRGRLRGPDAARRGRCAVGRPGGVDHQRRAGHDGHQRRRQRHRRSGLLRGDAGRGRGRVRGRRGRPPLRLGQPARRQR